MGLLYEIISSASPKASQNETPFSFTIDTRNAEVGSTSTLSYRLPLISVGSYDFNVSWGDGTSNNITTWNQTEATHTYNVVGEYDIIISENSSSGVNGISWATQDGDTLTPANDRLKLTNVKSWGPAILSLDNRIFNLCRNWYMTATDVPNFSDKSFRNGRNYFFQENNNLSGDFSNWGTVDSPLIGEFRNFFSNTTLTGVNPNLNFYANPSSGSSGGGITSIQGAFARCDFTGSFSNWDLSQITDFSQLFYFNSSYNNPEIVNLEVSNSINTSFMFGFATSFNQDISGWDVSSVTNMSAMFDTATSFNQDISGWDVSSVTNMNSMFNDAVVFNVDISGWDVSNVTTFERMFAKDGSTNMIFNQPVGSWTTTALTGDGLDFVFIRNTAFNQPLDNWNTSNITRLYRTFYDATAFNNDITSSWDVSKVTNFQESFRGATSFNQDLSTWNVSSGSNFIGMFNGCTSFNQPLNSWSMGSATNLGNMLAACTSFNQPLNNWDVSNVTNMVSLFSQCTSFNQPLNNWDVSNVTNMQNTFYQVIDFDQDISGWDVSSVTTFSNMFTDNRVFNADISGWDIGSATSLQEMFLRTGLSSNQGNQGFDQNIGSWDISNVTTCHRMFRNAYGFSDENWSNLLIGWAAQAPNIQSNVSIEANLQQYSGSIASSARNLLTGTYGWTIIDGGDNGE